ncbi:hypothetical protein NMY22_g9229 [Coprinellus aureogranulatus]|nr:hypothetical protein NMY22_g9229 [Coprinellus aureogranulatus]
MASSPRMVKRKRTEEPSKERATEEPTPTRSEKVWFEDGNIVIQAKPDNVQFKVHRGVLSKQSPVFSGLFDVPHPPSEPTVDGCPVVELHDAAVDMENALLALYGDQAQIGTMNNPPFPSLAAMIRIGKKYDIPYLRDDGLARLKWRFPATLQEFDKTSGCRTTGTPSELRELFHIINLAHECSIHSILPALYLQAASYSLDDLLLEEGAIPHNALRGLLQGRERLLQAKRSQVADYGKSGECDSYAGCIAASQLLLSEWWRAGSDFDASAVFDPWSDVADIIDDTLAEGYKMQLCHSCLQSARTTHIQDRTHFWDALPIYFKLPAWDQLKDFQG